MAARHSLRLGSWGVLAVVWACGLMAVASTEVTDLGGNQYRVAFAFQAPAGTKTVCLAGTFNGWDPRAHAMQGPDEQHVFRTSLVLGQGRHEYKFVLDGETWTTDPDNPYKTPGYQNAILFLGIAPPVEPGPATTPPEPVEMAAEVEHPPQLRQLLERLADRDKKVDPAPTLEKWFAEHPMPLFTEGSVTFVYTDGKATEVSVQIAGPGSRTGYALHRLTHLSPDREGAEHTPAALFVVSLERAKLPERMAYTFEVQRDGRTETLIDPHAWSLTSRSGQPAALAVEASDRRGRIEVIRDLKPSTGALRSRDVYVYLPPGYARQTDRRYSVLYMHDGQNCWDDPVEPFGHGGWCVNLHADRLINAGTVAPFIVVGIANTPDRMSEYGPGQGILSAAEHSYIRLLKQDVKPLIDRKYRTLPDSQHTALMGSSMGGLISFQAALLCPDTFGMGACLSPAFAYTEGSAQRYAGLVKNVGKVPVRLYLDSGTAGAYQDGASHTRAIADLLRETGWTDGKDLTHFEDTGADHNEQAWRARLEKPLLFLFGR
ncbi:MAG: alpha/beta hydrolase-fold protein [Planctomycetota bacterium]